MQNPAFDKIQTNFQDLKPGDWFLPMTLKGQDQHSLIPLALEKGICGLTIEEGSFHFPTESHPLNCENFNIPHLRVPNLREYLFSLACQKSEKLNFKSVAIAGSNGKTSVKELLGHILKGENPESTHVSPANQNTKIALATQILRMPTSVTTAVFEVGARRTHDFVIPLGFLKPSIATLLNIGTAHVGEFGSQENLVKEKLSILNASEAQFLIVPSDNHLIYQTATQIVEKNKDDHSKHLITFGYESKSDVQILDEKQNFIKLKVFHKEVEINLRFQSPARALNLAAVVALAHALGISWKQIQAGLQTFTGVSRRYEVQTWNGTTLIDDAFNSSPESLKQGLLLLSKTSADKNVLLVLGSMLELGETTQQEHKKVASQIFNLFHPEDTTVVSVGTEAYDIHSELQRLNHNSNPPFQSLHFPDALTAKSSIIQMSHQFDILYFKGSKAVQLQEIFKES